MKGNPDVIACLKELLRGELAARDQYFIHSRRYEDQGLFALYERLNHEMEEETQHADALLRRIDAGVAAAAVATSSCSRSAPRWRSICSRGWATSVLVVRRGHAGDRLEHLLAALDVVLGDDGELHPRAGV